MKYLFSSKSLFILILFLSCGSLPGQGNDKTDGKNKSTGVSRYVNTFDHDNWVYRLNVKEVEGVSDAAVELRFDSEVKQQGERSLRCDYSFTGDKGDQPHEKISLEKIWTHRFRTDLSFHPVGLSLWINSSGSNDRFSLHLLQQNEDFTLRSANHYSFTYSNDTILARGGWQQLEISYDQFQPSDSNPDQELNLARVNGYRFDIENLSQTEHSGSIHFDAFEQNTSYQPEVEGVHQFSSIFISLNPAKHVEYDWDTLFDAYREIGIDSVIVQYAARGPKAEEYPNFFYQTDEIQWKREDHLIIENLMLAAEKIGMKIVMGLFGGRLPSDPGDAKVYDELFERNREILDDLYRKFSASPALAGWYIPQEFHDGFGSNNWWKYEDRMLLANYQQRVAAYAKSKQRKLMVCTAPALWRGRPADMTYDFFKSLLEKTPDIDILYLQDCAGRCAFPQEDIFVSLPHWYEEVKRACDETGVQFGVDIEAFKNCPAENIRLHSREWSLLKDQLMVAGMFTSNITMYSWLNFRPGMGAFDEYRAYLEERGLLNDR